MIFQVPAMPGPGHHRVHVGPRCHNQSLGETYHSWDQLRVTKTKQPGDSFLEKIRSFRFPVISGVSGVSYHLTVRHCQVGPSPNPENLKMLALRHLGICGYLREFCENVRFQRFQWQLSLCSTQPSDLEKHPGHPIAFPKTRSFRSFRCLTSKSIVFREKQVNTENARVFPGFWISRRSWFMDIDGINAFHLYRGGMGWSGVLVVEQIPISILVGGGHPCSCESLRWAVKSLGISSYCWWKKSCTSW